MCAHLPSGARLEAKEKLSLLSPKGFRGRVKNRCSLTGKSRGVLRKFSMSQTSVRFLARSGNIPGMKKSSWLFNFFTLLW